MPKVAANGVHLHYESRGKGEPLVLVMGVGAQLLYWPGGFCNQLAARGFEIICFDNRDVGLSDKCQGARVPPFWSMVARAALGQPIDAPYTLADMADDTAGLIKALGHERAHVVGASMGGMIAQTLAIRHPDRLFTMTSIMSHPGDRRFMAGQPKALRVLLGKPPRNREEAADRAEEFYGAVNGEHFPLDVDMVRARSARAFDRCFYPAGFARHMAAILASGSRTAALHHVTVPSLVIHGSDDPLIRPAGGRATARAIPGARLEIIDGMGHELPEGAWTQVIDAIVGHAEAAGFRRSAGNTSAPSV
ncbi:MAG: alpha/beta hydrolase [Deltaproteobacteria bacterium]|nr:alpha/beta hydrolase [Deltaproteobacteria bacterium]